MKTIYPSGTGTWTIRGTSSMTAIFRSRTRRATNAPRRQDMQRNGVKPKRVLSSRICARANRRRFSRALWDRKSNTTTASSSGKSASGSKKDLNAFRAHVGYDRAFKPNTEGIESFDSMAERIASVVRELVDELADGESALVVGHREPSVSGILRLRGATDWKDIPLLDLPRGAWKLDFDSERNASRSG